MGKLRTFSGRAASQEPEELGGMIDLFRREGVRSYLEIGARHGDTFHAVMSALPADAFGLAIDLPGGAWGQRGSADALMAACHNLREQGKTIAHSLGDSAHPDMVEFVRALGPFDAILIDGDHRYEGVKRDWENYGPMGRIVAFHDIAGEGVMQKTSGDPVEVPRLWRELKESLPLLVTKFEYIAPASRMGIGVLLKPRPQS